MSQPETETRCGPGRPRAFDEATVLQAALGVFQGQGYAATSLDDLTRAMGISRSSFYATFGCKHGVLMAAIEAYSRDVTVELGAVEAVPGQPLALTLLDRIAKPDGDPRGCLLMNALIELAPNDPQVMAFAQGHFDRLTAIFARALDPEQTEHSVDRARALVALGLGTIVLRKAGLSPAAIAATLAKANLLIGPGPPHAGS